ncbi:MAG: YeeE/YedE family protein [Nitrospirae bacterium]|nr:YeeE/YedE family protein [Nitrospirota bacterium]MCL5423448.1 YeeE/YedE family protein [Nitrospirota bacterium]
MADQENNKKGQIWAFLITGIVILISLLYYKANIYYMYLVAYMWFGFAYGMMLQYGRFCFASASRDLFAAGVPRMAVGILVALIFFSLIQATLASTNMSTFHPAPFGIHTLISGMIFGVGMVLAGGCASGSLYKIGEGNGTSFLAAFFGLCIGQAVFVDVKWFNFLIPQKWVDSALAKGLPADKMTSSFDTYLAGYVWNQPTLQMSHTKAISDAFPGALKYFVGDSLLNALIPATVLLIVIYWVWIRKGFMKKRAKQKGGATGFGDELAGLWNMITASKRTTLMGVLIGIVAGLHIFVMKGLQIKFGVGNFGQLLTRMGHTGDVSIRGTVFDPGYWYITSQEGQLGAWILEKFGWNMRDNIFFGINNGLPEPWRNPALWMSLGIIFGAMAMARLNNEFKFKLPKGELIAWGLIGGLLMGWGSRPALGCNIGAFFIRVAGGDPSGWLYGIGMVGGAFIGVKFFNWWSERKMAKEMEAF